jgi:hypothetical protein
LELSTSTEYDTAFEIVDDFEDFKAAAALAGLELL